MTALHMVELCPDWSALQRFVHSCGLRANVGCDDLGYGVHSWLAGAFGSLAPKPWRLIMHKKYAPKILGYTQHDADALRRHISEFANPGAFAVCPEPEVNIVSRTMPTWKAGRRVGFDLYCCPVGRMSGTGVEKDLFLIRAEGAQQPLQREAVYADWACERIEREQAASVMSIHLNGFRLTSLLRQTKNQAGSRNRVHLVRPQVSLCGELTVVNPQAFMSLLATGIGRHRAFGFGMLLLRPPS